LEEKTMVAVMVPAVDQVSALYKAARGQLADELVAARVLQLPPVSAVGLAAADAVLRARPDLAASVGLIVGRAMNIPPASRQRRTLAGLGKWLIGVPGHLLSEERWFSVNVVREVAAASAGTATPPEVAGLIALTILNPA
jgi:hypothetical protein